MDISSPHNLPEQPHSLLGRDREMEAAQALLRTDDVRLLTLTGAPGVGKTRLAMELARTALDAFSDGVWFVDLAPVQEPDLVGSKIAGTFGLAVVHEDRTLDSLLAYLEGRQLLLFLDNFEQVLPAASWISGLLERTTTVTILTTSREPLRLSWERVMPLSPLPVPDLEQRPEFFTLLGTACIELFVQRATAVNPDFILSPENAPAITALCARLDGLPLAIELAAARASVLSADEILAHMDDRFRLLGTGAQDLPERQQTLEGAIGWSYEALPPAAAQFLRRLSVFSGGFSLGAASTVAESEALGLDALQSLIAMVENGLVVRARDASGPARFTLLESIRDYLLAQLRASGELDDARRRHARYYLALAERNDAEITKEDRTAWLALLEREHDNFRAALQWSLEEGELLSGKRIGAALWNPFWWFFGHVQEGARWLQALLERGGPGKGAGEEEAHMWVLAGAGTLRGWQGDFAAGKAYLMEALQMAEARNDEKAAARIVGRLAWIFVVNGSTEEAAWVAGKLDDAYASADPWDLAYAYLGLGSLQVEGGLDLAAERTFSQSLSYFERTDEKGGAHIARSKLALLAQRKGKLQDASAEMAGTLAAVGQSTDLHVTVQCAEDAIEIVALGLAEPRAVPLAAAERVARVLGALDHWRDVLGGRRTPRQEATYQALSAGLRLRLGEEGYRQARREGRARAVPDVTREAAELIALSGRPEPASQRSAIALSQRESQVLALVAEGLTAREIGEQLFITERTVRFHITSIFNKLGANNRAQAVAIASERGLL